MTYLMLLVVRMLGMTEYFDYTPDNQPNNQQDENEIICGQFYPYHRYRRIHSRHLPFQGRKKYVFGYPIQA
jgi:hypothetical protein